MYKENINNNYKNNNNNNKNYNNNKKYNKNNILTPWLNNFKIISVNSIKKIDTLLFRLKHKKT